jgi:hypothetical protein
MDASLYTLAMTVGCTPSSKSSSAFFRNSPASTAAVVVPSPTSSSWVFATHDISQRVHEHFIHALWSQGRPYCCCHGFGRHMEIFQIDENLYHQKKTIEPLTAEAGSLSL